MARYTLEFASDLAAPPERVWAWAISVEGIGRELHPLARMTLPAGAVNLLDGEVELGRPLARSWMLLFGFVPLDRLDLTLVELEPGRRFVEQSPMHSLRLWRHERRVEAVPGGCRITDVLGFEPRFGAPLVRWLVDTLFRHRHRVLRDEFGALAAPGEPGAPSGT